MNENRIEIRLADYLLPNGKYPYKQLAEDMKSALAKGKTVWLISVPGFLMGIGHPDLQTYPWSRFSGTTEYYKTPEDLLAMRDGITFAVD